MEYETYIVYVTSLNSIPLNIYPFRRPQIFGLITKKALIKVSNKYADFTDVFSSDLTSELPEHTGINDHAIKLVDG